MQEIRARAVVKRTGGAVSDDPDEIAQPVSLAKLNDLLARLKSVCARLDDPPPQPPTTRGRVGTVLVNLVRRVLFWQYVQAREFSAATASLLAEVCTDIEQTNLAMRAGLQSVRSLAEQAAAERKHGLEAAAERLSALEERVARLEQDDSAAEQLSTFQERIARLEQNQSAAERLSALQEQVARLEQHDSDRLTEVARTEKRLLELDVYSRQTRRETTLQSARIGALARRIAPERAAAPDVEDRSAITGAMEALYLSFEDAYRGDPGEIKRRLAAYIPILGEYGVKPELGPALDVGCGRGEWLELLAEAGFTAKGCDTNQDMVESCKQRGLDVTIEDGLKYLRSLPNGSLAIVSAMHVIEHLPVDILIGFITASLAALKPGGILILESPNPQNILVAAHNFYLDPTHERPIPMHLAHFLVEASGFCDTRSFGLNPYPASIRIDEASQVAQRFNDYFYGPQDYAVVGRRI